MLFQENEQYQAWTYRNPTYTLDAELRKLNDTFLSSFQHQEVYHYEASEFIQDPPTSYDYSTLKGRIMGTQDTFDITSVKAEVIVLDFWYSACYPCIKSIPEVNKLYQKFKDRNVVVYGVNIIDDEVKNKTRMEKYIRNNPMAYPTIMAERAKYQDWTSTGYPMLVLLNSKYEIIEAHIGYSEGMAEELSVLIEEHLKD